LPALPDDIQIEAVIGKNLRWHLTTTRGEIVIGLRPDVAPWTVATIVALTQRGTYNGIAFHRVVPNFVVQGGDPTESGYGGPGFAIPLEPATVADSSGFARGGVGVADAGRDSGGSQYFVMQGPAPHLDGRYSWFGTVLEGQDAADALLIGDEVTQARIEALDAPDSTP
jgi:cyclophilin family peptidyl-prolyl cis-trans isomerase